MKIVFFGSPQFAVPFLNALVINEDISVVGVVTQPDKPVGRSGKTKPSAIAEASSAYEIPVLKPKTLKDDEVVKELKNLEADAYVVIAYGNIIPNEILEIPRLGVINVHPSLLPKYRGATPMQSAILEGDSVTGITIMKMDEKMDHGPILAQLEIEIPDDMDYPELEMEVTYKGPQLLIDSLMAYERELLSPTDQEHDKATFVKLFNRNTGEIDWKSDARLIERMIRAYRPWPGVWTTLNGKRFKILRAKLGSAHPMTKVGTVVERDGEVEVVCKKGSLVLEEVQLTGSKPTEIDSFVNGHPEFVGSVLGN